MKIMSHFIPREIILFLFSVIIPLFVFFIFYKDNEPPEVSAVISACYAFVVGLMFPDLCDYGITCIYEQPPLGIYLEIYALVGASTAGIIASYETDRRLNTYFETKLVNNIKIIASLICSIFIGYILLKYDVVLDIPVEMLVIFSPIYWMFGRFIYGDGL